MKKKLPTLPKKRRNIHAFTLVEIMVALVIMGIIGTILTSFMIDSSRSMLWSVNKSLITNDFRKFTNRITQDAYNASFAYLYPDFTLVNSDEANDRLGVGLSGDCLVLVHTEPFPNLNSQRFFRRIVVYYRQPNSNQNAARPVLRQELLFAAPVNSTANNGNDPNFFEAFLGTQRANLTPPETVLQSARGLTNNQLFNRLTVGTFFINGEIISGTNAQSITNTYNLTISTGG